MTGMGSICITGAEPLKRVIEILFAFDFPTVKRMDVGV
jgi:hypothetical protein